MTNQKEIKVLVVDHDQATRNLLEKFLLLKDIYVITTDSVSTGAKLLKKDHFDIVMTDINMPEINGFEFLLWMKKHQIQTNIIIMSSIVSEAAKKTYSQYGILKYIPKPVNLEQLLWIINVIRNEGFISRVNEVSLFDYLQMVTMTKKNKVVNVTAPSITEGKIYVKEGEIVHSVYNNIKGEEAFFKIMATKGGSFSEMVWEEPSELTIKVPASAIIFRAGEVIDEENIKKSSSPQQSKNQNTYNVLIVDDDENIRNLICTYLAKQPLVSADSAGSAHFAAKLLKEKVFDLVITDVNMPEVNGFEFLLWMKKNNINSKVIVMSEDQSEETKNTALQYGALKFFNKSSTIQELYDFIKQDNVTGFTGTVSQISLFDYVQMVILSRKNKLIVVRSPLSDEGEGYIYFKNGSVIHAIYGELKGKDAFFKIVSIIGGIISESPWQEPSEVSINMPPSTLLFKTTMFIDAEKMKTSEVKIDDNVINSIEQKINNVDLNNTRIFTKTGSFQKVRNEEEKHFPEIKLTPFLKLQSQLGKQPLTPSNQKQKDQTETLTPFDGMKCIVPYLSKIGELAVKDTKTPLAIYQMLKKFDGENDLDYIYRNYYYHLSGFDFLMKLDGVKSYISFKKKENLPADKDLKGKIIQILVYMKFIEPKELEKRLKAENIDLETGGMSGENLVKLGLISIEQLNTALNFQRKFNLILGSLS